MEINPLLQAINTVTVATNTTIPPEIQNWQAGQLLEAIATSQTQNGQVKLQVGQTLFEVRVQFPVEPGQKIILEVVKQANPPILQLAQTDANKNAIVNAALRAVLPKQVSGIPPLLSNISYLSSSPVQQRSTLSPEILVLAKTFFNLLPEASKISTPDGLRQAVKDSGIFLENKLAGKDASLNNSSVKLDLKAGLLQLRQAIQVLSHNQEPSKTISTLTGNQKTVIPSTGRPVTGGVLSTSSQSTISKSFVDYPAYSKSILNRAIENLSDTRPRGEIPLKISEPLSSQNKSASLNYFINNRISSNAVTGKFTLNNSVTSKTPGNVFVANNLINSKPAANNIFSVRPGSYNNFTFTPVTSSSYSSKLTSSSLLFNKSAINRLVIRNQLTGKAFERSVTSTGNTGPTDKQPISSTTDARTNIQKALDIARNISGQVRDTANTIRNTLGSPQRTSFGSVPGTGNIPGISTLPGAQNLPGSSQAGREEILKALSGSEDLNYLQTKKGPPLAQSRAQATINQMSSIDQLITTLLKDVESSLARVQFHQLNTQQQDTDTKQAWVMELPVRKENGADIFHLHVERDSQQHTGTESENKSAWTIRLSFSLEGLGPVHTRISLSGDKISTIFWLEEKLTTDLFQKHLSELQENLMRAGINIEKLHCLNGSPPETEKYFFPQQLLHEKA